MDNKNNSEKNKKIIEKLRPHYIFNVLWNIQYLYKRQPKDGEKMLMDFSTFLRGKISDLCYDGLIPFEDEFEQTRAYIEIEQMRASDTLNLVTNFDFVDFEIPGLIIQPLVENAIKHGIYPKEADGTLTINSYKKDGKVFIEINDDGVGFDITKLNKKDADNLLGTEERLRKYYEDGRVDINSKIDEGTQITISFSI